MGNSERIGYALALGVAGFVLGCQDEGDKPTARVETAATTRADAHAGDDHGHGLTHSAPGADSKASTTKEATATLEPSQAPGMDDVKGTVHFMSTGTGVKIHATVTGLTPNGKHGFHIHEKGDLSAPDLASAGGHFNPGGQKHGGPEGADRHGGDLGNLTADASGNATYDATVEGLTIDDATTGVLGKSVVVHEKADDLTTDPSGSSGARVAGGVIKMGGEK